MPQLHRALNLFTILTLTGCTQSLTSGGDTVTRQDIQFTSQVAHADLPELRTQTAELNALMRDLVRQSTRKGILTGALAGCGLAVVSASNAPRCVAGAAAGGLVGGVIGNAQGKRQ